MDRFEAMSLLLETIEHGSMSAAARKLQVPLPTLSRKLSDLEQLLGTKLLTRTTRKLTLTDAGIAYAEAAKRILEQVQDAERMAAGEFMSPKGELVLTAPVMFGRHHVLPVVIEFLKTFPEIDVRLMLSDRNAHLIDDHIDMAVRIGQLPDSAMVATRVGTMRTVLCASPSLLVKHGEPTSPEDIQSLPAVSFDSLGPTRWSLRDPATRQDIGILINPRLSVSTAEAAIDAAVAGVGLTRVLHYQAAAAIADGKLRILMSQFEVQPLPINLIHVGRKMMPLKMRSFIDYAAPRLRDRLSRLVARKGE